MTADRPSPGAGGCSPEWPTGPLTTGPPWSERWRTWPPRPRQS